MYSSFAANFQVNDAQSDALALAIESALDAGAPPLEIALTYCRHGIPVFPLSAETKRPYEKGSHHLATIDEPVIRTWWLRWPGAAVGIAAGPPSRVWLLDLDERPGGSQPRLGITALRNLGFEPSRVAKCIVETPSGGLHLAFRLPPGTHIPNRAGDIAPGVDVRGTTRLKKGSASENNADRYTARGYEDRPDIVSGGYCVAAGSRRADGRHYAFKKGSYLSAGPAPLRLLRLAVFNAKERRFIDGDAELQHRLEAAEPQQWAEIYANRRVELAAETVGRSAGHGSYGDCDVSRYAKMAFETELAALSGACEGQRDSTLWRAACSLMELVKAGALGRAEVERELLKAALSIGLEERIIVEKLSRAYEHVDPRDLSHVGGVRKQKPRQEGPQTGGNDGGDPDPSTSEPREEQSGSTASSFGEPLDGEHEDGDVEPTDAHPKPPNQLIDGIPGALGILAAHIRDIDPYSDEVRALTISIAATASLAGAGYECRNFNHTTCCDLFLVNLGGSGTGKTDLTKKAIRFVQEAVGRRDSCPFQFLGGAGSGEGLWDAVAASNIGGCPFATYVFDEFGDELSSMMALGSYKAGALTLIRQLTNAGDSVISAPKLSLRSKAAPRSPLAYPVVSFLGITTGRQFVEALGSGRMLENGIEARMLALPSGEPGEFDVVSLPTPKKLIPALQEIWKQTIEVTRQPSGERPNRILVHLGEDVETKLLEMLRAQSAEASRLDQQGEAWASVVNRRTEHVIKLAMLWAISADPAKPVITHQAINWAASVVAYKEEAFSGIRAKFVTLSQRSEEGRVLRAKIVEALKVEQAKHRRDSHWSRMRFRDLMRYLKLDRDEAAKEVNNLITQELILAFDREGKSLEEVQRNRPALLKPRRTAYLK